jgi:hypothetical protein
MNGPRIPISQLLSDKSTADADDDPNQKKSREDWRKAKELEEARKAGNAPAAVDEEGKWRKLLFVNVFMKVPSTSRPRHQPAHPAVHFSCSLVLRHLWSNPQASAAARGSPQRVFWHRRVVQEGRRHIESRHEVPERRVRELRRDDTQEEGLPGKAKESGGKVQQCTNRSR